MSELAQLLDRLSLPPESVDLFLDFEAIARMPGSEGGLTSLLAVAVDALKALTVVRYRNVVVCGSSLPESMGKRHDWEPVHVRRQELALWQGLLHLVPNAVFGFGDYGIVFPFETDVGKPVRPPSRVRLCNAEEHVIYRARPEEYRRLCAVALEDKSIMRFPVCWGIEQLYRCSVGSAGLGRPSDWVARDTNFHLEATVVMIEREITRTGRLSSLDFPEPELIPWFQDRIEFHAAR